MQEVTVTGFKLCDAAIRQLLSSEKSCKIPVSASPSYITGLVKDGKEFGFFVDSVGFWRKCCECGYQVDCTTDMLFKLFIDYVGKSGVFVFGCMALTSKLLTG
jgi:hypothetical protein